MPDIVRAVFLLVTILLPLAALVIALVVFGRRTPRIQAPFAGAPGAPGGLPTAGQWHAQLSAPGAMLLHGGYGTVDVSRGMVTFTPAEPGRQGWAVPAPHVRAGLNAMLLTQELWLETPTTGRVALTVSREHINRFMGNDLKHFRERGYAKEFLATLHANGGIVA